MLNTIPDLVMQVDNGLLSFVVGSHHLHVVLLQQVQTRRCCLSLHYSVVSWLPLAPEVVLLHLALRYPKHLLQVFGCMRIHLINHFLSLNLLIQLSLTFLKSLLVRTLVWQVLSRFVWQWRNISLGRHRNHLVVITQSRLINSLRQNTAHWVFGNVDDYFVFISYVAQLHLLKESLWPVDRDISNRLWHSF